MIGFSRPFAKIDSIRTSSSVSTKRFRGLRRLRSIWSRGTSIIFSLYSTESSNFVIKTTVREAAALCAAGWVVYGPVRASVSSSAVARRGRRWSRRPELRVAGRVTFDDRRCDESHIFLAFNILLYALKKFFVRFQEFGYENDIPFLTSSVSVSVNTITFLLSLL